MILLRGRNEVLNYFALSEIATAAFQSVCSENGVFLEVWIY